jgi:hypothetical protein
MVPEKFILNIIILYSKTSNCLIVANFARGMPNKLAKAYPNHFQ